MKTLNSIFLIFALIYLAGCSDQIRQSILKNFEKQPKKEFFKIFHYLYNKEYDLNSEEGMKRYSIFKDNLKIINDHNTKQSSYILGVNQFADMTNQEFAQKFLMKPETKRKQMENIIRNLREEGYFNKFEDIHDNENIYSNLNKSEGATAYNPIDWRSSLETPRDQGSCGSCWTFAVTGVMESFRNRKAGTKKGYLSTQQLVDCDISNNGCNGGDFYNAFKYTMNNGIVNETDYPYKAIPGQCNIPNVNSTKIKSYSFCSNYWSSSSLKCSDDKVYTNLQKGVSAVGIDGSIIQLYESGIFTETCSEDNHAVILVGYGIENGKEYFIVRNSWGADWGENGYIRVARNLSNKSSCFVANESYTIVLP